MEQVKIFSKHNEPLKLEAEVNDWLSKRPDIKITRVLQSQSGKHVHAVYITIFYE